MDIHRSRGTAPGRNNLSIYGNLVFTVATAEGATMAEQTRNTLAALDGHLAAAGTDRSRILQSTVYVSDMALKPEMDAVWCDWIGDDPALWPQRACVQTGLWADTLVEIVMIAAKP